MKISSNGINLIKQFEGCKLKAYKCPAGIPTIGYGHTKDVKMGQVITQEQAEQYLRDDLEKYEKNVMKYYDTYKWNQNEFDALVSFAYNIGSIDQLTANGLRSKAVIADKLIVYNKAAGKVLTGLTKRRKAERTLFLKAVKVTAATATSTSNNIYYPKYIGDGTLLEALKDSGCKDTSLSFRRKIAVKNGICKSASTYLGTKVQNTKMLNLLKQGNLLKP